MRRVPVTEANKQQRSSKDRVIKVALLVIAAVVVGINLFVGWRAWQMHKNADQVESKLPKSLPSSESDFPLSNETGSAIDLAKQWGSDEIIRAKNKDTLKLEGAPGFSEQALKSLSKQESVTKLLATRSNFTDRDTPFIIGLPLTHLDLSATAITDKSMPEIAKIKTLRHLSLEQKGLPNFKPELITGKGVAHLTTLKNLEDLELAGTAFSDKEIPLLLQLPKLRILDLSFTRITNNGMKDLAKLTNLTTLKLSGNDLNDEGIEQLKPLRKLTVLYLGHAELTEIGLASLIDRPLVMLRLDSTSITDRGLQLLTKVKTLRTVNVWRCHFVSANGVAQLRKELPNCEVVNDRSQGLL